ncbi:MAG: hypothetical protein ACI90V_011961, partial [Bacillariaceae sp.]
ADENTTALTSKLFSISPFHICLASSDNAKLMVLTLFGQSNRIIATPSFVNSMLVKYSYFLSAVGTNNFEAAAAADGDGSVDFSSMTAEEAVDWKRA